MATEFLHVGARPAKEYAAVPVEVARLHVLLRRRHIGLFVELGNATNPVADPLACANVAVAGVRTRGPHAEGDQLAGIGGIQC